MALPKSRLQSKGGPSFCHQGSEVVGKPAQGAYLSTICSVYLSVPLKYSSWADASIKNVTLEGTSLDAVENCLDQLFSFWFSSVVQLSNY